MIKIFFELHNLSEYTAKDVNLWWNRSSVVPDVYFDPYAKTHFYYTDLGFASVL